MSTLPHILFLAEGASLSHVGRALYFGALTDRERCAVTVAADPAYQRYVLASGLRYVPMSSAGAGPFLRNAYWGKPLFNHAALRAYADEDRRLFESLRPDLVIADMRLSVIASAPALGLPYAMISNSYWRKTERELGPIPDHPLLRLFGPTVFQFVYRRIGRRIQRGMAAPLQQLRREFGLPAIGSDLVAVNTLGDFTLFADDPVIHPLDEGAPANAFSIGPALWQMDMVPPDWWDTVSRRRPLVYVNLGSSGDPRALPKIVEALAACRVTAVVCRCGSPASLPSGPDIHYCDYFPNAVAARVADAVICNGGSTSGYLSIAGGAPLIGIPGLMEQALSMDGFVAAGVGIGIDLYRLSTPRVVQALRQVLENPSYREKARAYQASFRREAQAREWNALLARMLGSSSRIAA